jgi:predicted TIM-barrel fold metal-dependent hydrolase
VSQGHDIRSTVFIEARAMYRADGPAEMKPVGEVEFVQGLAAASASGLYGPGRAAAAIVGHADMKLGDRVAPVLEALQAASPNRFRGIRHIVTWNADPRVESREKEGVLSTPEFRAAGKVLERMGLSLDTICCWPQLPELVEFCRTFEGKDGEVIPGWQDGIAELAKCPNVLMKLGGVGMPRFGFDWHLRDKPIGSEELAGSMAPWMDWCIEQFGPGRCMFESNFPVDKVSFSHGVVFNAFKRLSRGYSPSERAALFHDTAVKAYRIGAA